MSSYCDVCRHSFQHRDACRTFRGAPPDGRCAGCGHGAPCHPTQRMRETPDQLRARARLQERGHTCAAYCPDCGAAIAGCGFGETPCGRPAYKWVPLPGGGEVYFCEEHGYVPDWLEELGFVSQWAAYQPGREGCSCGYGW